MDITLNKEGCIVVAIGMETEFPCLPIMIVLPCNNQSRQNIQLGEDYD